MAATALLVLLENPASWTPTIVRGVSAMKYVILSTLRCVAATEKLTATTVSLECRRVRPTQ